MLRSDFVNRRDLLAGVATFLASSYILFATPEILSKAGMPKSEVFVSTAIASAVACFLMAFIGKRPYALAPIMGLNTYFAFEVCKFTSFKVALLAIFIEGLIFVFLASIGFVSALERELPEELKLGLGLAVGAFLLRIGVENISICALTVFLVALFFYLMKVKYFFLIAMLSSLIFSREISFKFELKFPSEILLAFHTPQNPIFFFGILLVFFCVDFFDSLATLLILDKKSGRKGLKEPMVADGIAASFGAVLGTSTISTLAESEVAVEMEASEKAGYVTGLLFALSILLLPLLALFPPDFIFGILMMVGLLMLKEGKKPGFPWIPALLSFLTSISLAIPLAFLLYTPFELRKRKKSLIFFSLLPLFTLYLVLRFMMMG